MGFQETDIVSVAAPITKAAWRVETPEELPGMLQRSFELALSGRPGPVLLDDPWIFNELICPLRGGSAAREADDGPPATPASQVDSLFARRRTAVGPRWRRDPVGSCFGTVTPRDLLSALGVPVVNSLMGSTSLPYTSDLRSA